jgi:hypothetical protein
MEIRVYVPRVGAMSCSSILPKSGIVGTVDGPERVRIDFEGARYGQMGMETWADKLLFAAGRHVTNYPTVARLHVPREDLVDVGWWDTEANTVDLDGDKIDHVREWLGDAFIAAECCVSGSGRRGRLGGVRP